MCRRRINSYSSISILDPDHDSDTMPLMSANPEDNTQQPATSQQGYDIGSPYLLPGYTEKPIRLQYPSSINWLDICFAASNGLNIYYYYVFILFIYILSMCVHPLAHLCPMAATLNSHNHNADQHFTGDNCVSLSITMTLVALILGGWPSLVCTISALVIAYSVSTFKSVAQMQHCTNSSSQGRGDERRGKIQFLPDQRPPSHFVSTLLQSYLP